MEEADFPLREDQASKVGSNFPLIEDAEDALSFAGNKVGNVISRVPSDRIHNNT